MTHAHSERMHRSVEAMFLCTWVGAETFVDTHRIGVSSGPRSITMVQLLSDGGAGLFFGHHLNSKAYRISSGVDFTASGLVHEYMAAILLLVDPLGSPSLGTLGTYV